MKIAAPILYVLVLAAFVLNGYVLLCCRWLRRPVSANLALSLSLAGADIWVAVLTGQSLGAQRSTRPGTLPNLGLNSNLEGSDSRLRLRYNS